MPPNFKPVHLNYLVELFDSHFIGQSILGFKSCFW